MKINKEQIELLQAKAELTSKKLSELSGLSRQQISTVKGRGTCTPTTAAKLARGLGVKIEEIMESEG